MAVLWLRKGDGGKSDAQLQGTQRQRPHRGRKSSVACGDGLRVGSLCVPVRSVAVWEGKRTAANWGDSPLPDWLQRDLFKTP
jgi:hypothetical protein